MTSAPKRERVTWAKGRPPPRTWYGEVLLDRPATRKDLDDLPPTWRGEIIHGTLYAFPRPRARHQRAGGTLYQDIGGPFDRGRGGPGGWWIVIEPGIELPQADEVSPDIAGWRRERMPHLPREGAITIAPDWVCEVLSPSTRAYDLTTKRRLYAELAVPHVWYLDPASKLLTASKLEGGRWVELGAWKDNEKVSVEPFEAIEIDLAPFWEGFDLPVNDDGEETSPSPPSATL